MAPYTNSQARSMKRVSVLTLKQRWGVGNKVLKCLLTCPHVFFRCCQATTALWFNGWKTHHRASGDSPTLSLTEHSHRIRGCTCDINNIEAMIPAPAPVFPCLAPFELNTLLQQLEFLLISDIVVSTGSIQPLSHQSSLVDVRFNLSAKKPGI